MRKRKEIERDFNNTMPQRKGEQMLFQQRKLILEAQLDVRGLLEKLSAALKKARHA